jgi:hypothetical protein
VRTGERNKRRVKAMRMNLHKSEPPKGIVC